MNFYIWKILICFLKTIVCELGMVMLALGKQREPGLCGRLLSQPLSPQILDDIGAATLRPVLSYLTIGWLLLEGAVGYFLLSSETS